MKQMIVVMFLVVGIGSVCLYARGRASEAREQLNFYTNSIFEHIENDDDDKTKTKVGGLVHYWHGEQRRLILFFRHAEVDEISRSVSRLAALAEFDEQADLKAELGSIIWQIEHIWESDRVRIGPWLL